MTRAEYVEAHGCEPHDEGYWGSGGVNVAGRWGGRVHLSRGCDYHVSGVMGLRGVEGARRLRFPGQRIRS